METWVGERIKKLRKKKGFLAKDIALKLGISRPYYTQIEGGRRRLSADHLAQIARLLEVPMSELYGGTELLPPPRGMDKRVGSFTPADTPELWKRLEPVMGHQTAEVVDCIQMWITAPQEFKQALKAFHNARGAV